MFLSTFKNWREEGLNEPLQPSREKELSETYRAIWKLLLVAGAFGGRGHKGGDHSEVSEGVRGQGVADWEDWIQNSQRKDRPHLPYRALEIDENSSDLYSHWKDIKTTTLI